MATQLADIHPHIVSKDTERYPRAPVGGVRSEWSVKRSVTFEELVDAMDEAGVEKAAIVHSSTTYGFDNSYVADSIAKMPERFTGVYAVDVTQLDAVEKIEYWRKRGMTGIRLFTGGRTKQTHGEWLIDPQTFPAWEHAAKIGMTVCIQTTPEGLYMVTQLLERFPKVNIIIDHLARPVLEDGPPYKAAESLFALSEYPNLYLKMTPRTSDLSQKGNASPETFFPKLVSAFGANHIAFGSNYPASEGPLTKLVAEARECLNCLSEEDRSWIFARTAQLLYPELAD